MSAGTVILIVVVFLLLLALGGALAVRRRMRSSEEEFHARIRQANHDLAAAHAQDNGWEPSRLDAAARRAAAERRPGAEIEAVDLVQVIDRPGTEEDEAVYRVLAGGNSEEIRLARRGDDWVAAP